MNEQALLAALRALFPNADVTEAGGDHFFTARPARNKQPFLTVVTGDAHDTASHLSRPGVYRLNLSLSPAQYRARFSPPPGPRPDWGVQDTGHDYTALDTLMPHPVYAFLNWACVLNPSAATLEALRPLLLEAEARARAAPV